MCWEDEPISGELLLARDQQASPRKIYNRGVLMRLYNKYRSVDITECHHR